MRTEQEKIQGRSTAAQEQQKQQGQGLRRGEERREKQTNKQTMMNAFRRKTQKHVNELQHIFNCVCASGLFTHKCEKKKTKQNTTFSIQSN